MIVVELDAVATGLERYRNGSFGHLMPMLSGEREFNGSAIIYAYKEGPAAFEQVEDHHLVVSSFGDLDVIQDKVVASQLSDITHAARPPTTSPRKKFANSIHR